MTYIDVLEQLTCHPEMPLSLEAIELCKTALDKMIEKYPFKESRADYLCPECYNYLPFDALNEDIEEAPEICAHCGQHIFWDKPSKHQN